MCLSVRFRIDIFKVLCPLGLLFIELMLLLGEMKQWYHPKCLFETFERARATTKIIDSTDEIDGFTDLNHEDKDLLKSLISDIAEKRANKGSKTPAKKSTPKSQTKSDSKPKTEAKHASAKAASPAKKPSPSKVRY